MSIARQTGRRPVRPGGVGGLPAQMGGQALEPGPYLFGTVRSAVGGARGQLGRRRDVRVEQSPGDPRRRLTRVGVRAGAEQLGRVGAGLHGGHGQQQPPRGGEGGAEAVPEVPDSAAGCSRGACRKDDRPASGRAGTR